MLTIYQKSVYLMILNSTMILRSIGKTLMNKNSTNTILEFKISLFSNLNELIKLMNEEKITDERILNQIIALANLFDISVGQSQKAINVLLKYHFHFNNYSTIVKKALHCPIDSLTFSNLNLDIIRLKSLELDNYLSIQKKIQGLSDFRIDFDINWDKQHLGSNGLMN